METLYTMQDLKTMQSWSLERKIQVTQTRIFEWYIHYGGKVIVSFSGGLDSTVLLDLARRVSPDIKAVFVQTGMEYREILDFVKSTPDVTWLYPEIPFNKVLKEYGYPVISKDVSKIINAARRGIQYAQQYLQGLNLDGTPSKFNKRYIKWAYLTDAPFPISNKCCDILKKYPLDSFAKQTGNMPIIGTMASESFRRQKTYLNTGCNAFDKKSPSSQPLSFWSKQDILEYINLTSIPYSSVYGKIICDSKTGKLKTTGEQRTGCIYCMFGCHLEKTPNRFQRMAVTHPKEYDYCINKLKCGAVLDYIGVAYN